MEQKRILWQKGGIYKNCVTTQVAWKENIIVMDQNFEKSEEKQDKPLVCHFY